MNSVLAMGSGLNYFFIISQIFELIDNIVFLFSNLQEPLSSLALLISHTTKLSSGQSKDPPHNLRDRGIFK